MGLMSKMSSGDTATGGDSGLGHMLKIQGNISGEDVTLIFDTGIGVNLISKSLCSKLHCSITGSLTGKRMTGQDVTIPMAKVASLEVGGVKQTNVEVGVWDFKDLLPDISEFRGVQGYLSLNFFAQLAFTIDYKERLLIVENKHSLEERLSRGVTIPISKKYQGSALTIQVPVKVPTGQILDMQLDLGTDILTIGKKHYQSLKPFVDEGSVKSQSITDETGFNRDRSFVHLKGEINLPSPHLPAQQNPTVMFQEIIYDGVIGNDFFNGRIVTCDLPNSRLIVSRQ